MQIWLPPRARPDDTPDRRGAARQDPLSALGQMLDAVRRDGDLEAVLLADPAGVLVAGAGAFATCEELAALAPLVAPRPAANDTVPTRLDVMARKMEVRRLTIDGVEVLLCGRGGRENSGALSRAAAGCARILGRAARLR